MPPTKCASACGKLLGGKEVNAATFHDYCLDLLKRVHQDFGVLDDKDLWIYLRRRMRELHLEHFVRAANVGQFLNDLLDFVSRCHDELVTPGKIRASTSSAWSAEKSPSRASRNPRTFSRTPKFWAAAARSPAYSPPWSAGCAKRISAPSAT